MHFLLMRIGFRYLESVPSRQNSHCVKFLITPYLLPSIERYTHDYGRLSLRLVYMQHIQADYLRRCMTWLSHHG